MIADFPVPAALAERGITQARIFAVRLRRRFRRILVREGVLLHGSAGWGECAPFWDYDPRQSAPWLSSAIKCATNEYPVPRSQRVRVNATVPIMDPAAAAAHVANLGCATAKVKVADPGTDLAADLARIRAVSEKLGELHGRAAKVRVDANAAWDRADAVRAICALETCITSSGAEFEYCEQPCADITDLAWVRRHVTVPIAADESIRLASDPLKVARLGAADVAIIKIAPLGGIDSALEIAAETGLKVVISSALDTSVGISAGVAAAAALGTDAACGLGTVTMFTSDVTTRPLIPQNGFLPTVRPPVDAPLTKAPTKLTEKWSHRLELMAKELHD